MKKMLLAVAMAVALGSAGIAWARGGGGSNDAYGCTVVRGTTSCIVIE